MTLRSSFPPFLFLPVILLLFQCAVSSTAITRENYLLYYAKHCKDIESRPEFYTNDGVVENSILHFDDAYVRGGKGLLPPIHSASSQWEPPGTHLSFKPKWNTIFLAEAANVVSLHASLTFVVDWTPWINATVNGRNLRQIRFRPPKIPLRYVSLMFDLFGFWSMSTGKLCMVGSGSIPSNSGGVNGYDVALKLVFPVDICNYSSLITGMLESLSDSFSSTYFDGVEILGIPHCRKYKYSLVHEAKWSSCFNSLEKKQENLHLDMMKRDSCLSKLRKFSRFFSLDYQNECYNSSSSSTKCSFLGKNSGELPKFIAIKELRCDSSHSLRVLLIFSKVPHFPFGILRRSFDPETMLVGEASWNDDDETLHVVVCRVVNFNTLLSNASIGDCSTQLSLRIPSTMNIRDRYTVEGEVVSNDCSIKTKFHGSSSSLKRLGIGYDYTQLDRVRMICSEDKHGKGRREYPQAYSREMVFTMAVSDQKNSVTFSGYCSPLFVNNQLYDPNQITNDHKGISNVSYTVTIFPHGKFRSHQIIPLNDPLEIFAEGTYNSETGNLCLLGCRKVNFMDSMDCEILINFRFSPLNGDGVIKGTIKSMREKPEALYFDPFLVSSNSIYGNQAAKSMWVLDMKIFIALISNSLSCLFLGLELHHVRKNPQVLPHISILMLMLLTLGYMIPLLLNFEAFFVASSSHHNVLVGRDGWLELNEVTVRLITMVAFVLQFRLLQISWSSRNGSHKSLWVAEKNSVFVSLLVLSGFGVPWLVHQWRLDHNLVHSWSLVKFYGGLVIDLFLVPQIMFNCWMNSSEFVLTSWFYVGMSVVRGLSHAYNLYTSFVSPLVFEWSYGQRFSRVWDVVIPMIGCVLAALIWLQQRFGGHCILPTRFRQLSAYQHVLDETELVSQ